MVTIKSTDKEYLDTLRSMREHICFPIVNRGKLWYNTLTEEHLYDLERWYFAWLNVTETREIPAMPEWLNDKIKKEEILL